MKKQKKKPRGLGEWEKYMERAVSRAEAEDICFRMTDEGYSSMQIAKVIRFSPQTICNWRKKREQSGQPAGSKKGETEQDVES